MIVLGIDPGIERLGYALIELKGNELKATSFGLISTKKEDDKTVRFFQIYEDLQYLINKHQPSYISMEKIIFAKNVKTALTISELRGVIILLSAIHKLPLYEFTPIQVKMATTGYGRSGKGQIQKALKLILSIPDIPPPDDISDALAIALCGINAIQFRKKLTQ